MYCCDRTNGSIQSEIEVIYKRCQEKTKIPDRSCGSYQEYINIGRLRIVQTTFFKVRWNTSGWVLINHSFDWCKTSNTIKIVDINKKTIYKCKDLSLCLNLVLGSRSCSLIPCLFLHIVVLYIYILVRHV